MRGLLCDRSGLTSPSMLRENLFFRRSTSWECNLVSPGQWGKAGCLLSGSAKVELRAHRHQRQAPLSMLLTAASLGTLPTTTTLSEALPRFHGTMAVFIIAMMTHKGNAEGLLYVFSGHCRTPITPVSTSVKLIPRAACLDCMPKRTNVQLAACGKLHAKAALGRQVRRRGMR